MQEPPQPQPIPPQPELPDDDDDDDDEEEDGQGHANGRVGLSSRTKRKPSMCGGLVGMASADRRSDVMRDMRNAPRAVLFLGGRSSENVGTKAY